ncbi:hypothetical protein QWG76_22995, partial [Escherichia coli]|uniref:hypothetical protein n=1 Tax=Escherichia coli TaxID=562 RepID=UPI0031CC45C3
LVVKIGVAKTGVTIDSVFQADPNLRDAKFFPSGEPTNSPFIDRFCRRQKDYPLKLHWIVT